MIDKYNQVEKEIIASISALCVRYKIQLVLNPFDGTITLYGDDILVDLNSLANELFPKVEGKV